MDKAKCTQLFFRSERPESKVLRALEQFSGIAVECMDIPDPDAAGFAQFTQYTEGFGQGVLVSWPSGISPVFDEIHLVEGLASRLKTEVLLESIKTPDRWLLAKENGGAVDVRVRYLDDGIELEFKP